MRRMAPTFALLAVLLAPAACRSGAPRPVGVETAQERTILEVENRAFANFTIYAIRSGQRIRLGTAVGNSTTRLVIPPYVVTGMTELRFLADPIGGNRTPVSSEILVRQGETLTLTIPPQ